MCFYEEGRLIYEPGPSLASRGYPPWYGSEHTPWRERRAWYVPLSCTHQCRRRSIPQGGGDDDGCVCVLVICECPHGMYIYIYQAITFEHISIDFLDVKRVSKMRALHALQVTGILAAATCAAYFLVAPRVAACKQP